MRLPVTGYSPKFDDFTTGNHQTCLSSRQTMCNIAYYLSYIIRSNYTNMKILQICKMLGRQELNTAIVRSLQPVFKDTYLIG